MTVTRGVELRLVSCRIAAAKTTKHANALKGYSMTLECEDA